MENAGTATPETPKHNPVQLAAQLSDAYLKFNRALYDGTLASSKQAGEAASSFISEKQQIEQETARRAIEAYNEYARNAQEASGKENAQQLVVEAYQNYATTLAGLQQDACRRLQDLYGSLWSKSSEAAEAAKKRARQQYVDYLKQVQQVWSSLNMDSLVP